MTAASPPVRSRTTAEAARLANGSRCGLTASIRSSDVDCPLRIALGAIWINNRAVICSETEHGSHKQSDFAQLNGLAGTNDFIEQRTIVHEVDLAPAGA